MFNKKQIFGLRKLSIGLTSVVLGLSLAGLGASNVQAAEPAGTPVEQTEQTPQPEQKKTEPVSPVELTKQGENGLKAKPASEPTAVYKGKFIDAPEYSGESDQQREKFNEIAQKWDQEVADVVGQYYKNQSISEHSDAKHEYMVFGRLEKISGNVPDSQSINVARRYSNMRAYVTAPDIHHSDGRVDMPIGDNMGDASRFELGTIDSAGRFVPGTFDAAGHFVSGTNRISTDNWEIITPAIIVDNDGKTDKPVGSSSLIYSIRGTKMAKSEFKDALDKLHDKFPTYDIPQVDGYDSYYQIGNKKYEATQVPALLASQPYDITITYVPKPSTNPDKPTTTIPWTPLTPATRVDNTNATPEPEPEPKPTPEIPETPDHPEKPATSEKTAVEKPANKPVVHRTAKTAIRRQTAVGRRTARPTMTSYRTARTNFRQASQPVNHIARHAASLPQTGNKSYAALGAVALGAAVGLLGLAGLCKRRN
jgi:LPXTG-motif cell wall-anchored protein